ncbi:transporter substrate-binding domain-containing protein [Roseateles asaccharophilus]|uniref:Polar amino acid transport system substrate-binding protein n=1 Tax=Roseateles asaccharophilus TaxID=582607 RepID=A0ABU2AE18_9BURK|nr:transporter substrate-binding domain-containing protein [Roseateles asaccharophilus]MDR7335447.1 polar amino acid transport system substrate-binding protein [Roseateles asaccharophilus]
MAAFSWRWLLALLVGADCAAAPTTLKFVTKPFAPYTQAGPDGRPAGPLVELLQAACARLAWHCVVEQLPWRRALGQAERGEVDGLFPVVDSPGRRASFHVSAPVVAARYVLLGRSGPAVALGTGHPTLAGRTLAAYGPSDAAATLQQLVAGVSQVRTEIEPDHATVLRKLGAGRYGEDGLALVNEAVAERQRLSTDLGGATPVAVVKDVAYAYALVPSRVDAAQALVFARTLQALCASGVAAEIFRPHGLPAAACPAAAASHARQLLAPARRQ